MPGRPLAEQLAEALELIEVLRAENESLRDEVAQLKALLSADSSTTSKPPSGDPVGTRKKRAERRADAKAAKRAQGKQPGTPGSNLARRRADRLVGHEPPAPPGRTVRRVARRRARRPGFDRVAVQPARRSSREAGPVHHRDETASRGRAGRLRG